MKGKMNSANHGLVQHNYCWDSDLQNTAQSWQPRYLKPKPNIPTCCSTRFVVLTRKKIWVNGFSVPNSDLIRAWWAIWMSAMKNPNLPLQPRRFFRYQCLSQSEHSYPWLCWHIPPDAHEEWWSYCIKVTISLFHLTILSNWNPIPKLRL